MDSELSRAAAWLAGAIFGNRVNRVTPIERGVMTFKFLLNLADGTKCVLRFYPRTRAHLVDFEPDLVRRFRIHGLQVPKMLLDSRTGPRLPWEYCVYEYIQGVPLAERLAAMDSTSLQRLAEDLVGALQRISELQTSGFGELIGAHQAKYADWSAYIENVFSTGITAAEAVGLWSHRVLAELRQIQSRIGLIPSPGTPRLALGDLSPENVLIGTDNRLAGLLDFEGAIASEPLLNLGYSYARHLASPLFSEMQRVWPTEITETQSVRIRLYAVLRGLSIARYAGTPLPSGTKRSPIEDFLPGFLPAVRFLLAKL